VDIESRWQDIACHTQVWKAYFMAAVWAILAVVAVFSLLNLIEYRRID
jgi:hypothetical protein